MTVKDIIKQALFLGKKAAVVAAVCATLTTVVPNADLYAASKAKKTTKVAKVDKQQLLEQKIQQVCKKHKNCSCTKHKTLGLSCVQDSYKKFCYSAGGLTEEDEELQSEDIFFQSEYLGCGDIHDEFDDFIKVFADIFGLYESEVWSCKHMGDFFDDANLGEGTYPIMYKCGKKGEMCLNTLQGRLKFIFHNIKSKTAENEY